MTLGNHIETLGGTPENEILVKNVPNIDTQLAQKYGEVLVSVQEAALLQSGKLSEARLIVLLGEQKAQRAELSAELTEVGRQQQVLGDTVKAGNKEAIAAAGAASELLETIPDPLVPISVGVAAIKTSIASGEMQEAVENMPEKIGTKIANSIRDGFGKIFTSLSEGFQKFISFIFNTLGLENPLADIGNIPADVTPEVAGKGVETGAAVLEATSLPESFKTHPGLIEALSKAINEGDVLTPAEKTELARISNGEKLTPEHIKLLFEKDPQRLKEVINKIFANPEVQTILRDIATGEVVGFVQEKFPYIHLTPENTALLTHKSREFITQTDLIPFFQEYLIEGEEKSFGELIATSSGEILRFGKLLLGLVFSGVISTSEITNSLYEHGSTMIRFTIGFLTFDFPIEEAKAYFGELSESQKTLMFGLMYRKSGLLFDLIGSTVGHITQFTFDMLSRGESFHTGKWQTLAGDANKKLAYFEQIAGAFGDIQGSKHISDEVRKALEQSGKNHGIFAALQNAGNDGVKLIEQAKPYLGSDELATLENFIQRGDIPTARGTLIQLIKVPQGLNIDFLKAMYPGIHNLERAVIDSLQTSASYMQAAAKGENIHQILLKFPAILEQVKIGGKLERLSLNVTSLSEANTLMNSLKLAVNESPDFFKVLFRGVPEIAFIGLDQALRETDESALEQLIETANYMIPIWGPVQMLLSAKSNIDSDGVHFYNVAEAGIGIGFLGMDIIGLGGAIVSGKGLKGKILSIGKYSLRPAINIWNIGSYGVKNGINMYRGIAVSKFERQAFKEILEETMLKFKGIKNSRALAALAVVGLVGAGAWYMMQQDFGAELEHFAKLGILNKETGEINQAAIKNAFAQLSTEEKTMLAELMIQSSMSEISIPSDTYKIMIEGDTIKLQALSPSAGPWMIQPETRANLLAMGFSDLKYIS